MDFALTPFSTERERSLLNKSDDFSWCQKARIQYPFLYMNQSNIT